MPMIIRCTILFQNSLWYFIPITCPWLLDQVAHTFVDPVDPIHWNSQNIGSLVVVPGPVSLPSVGKVPCDDGGNTCMNKRLATSTDTLYGPAFDLLLCSVPNIGALTTCCLNVGINWLTALKWDHDHWDKHICACAAQGAHYLEAQQCAHDHGCVWDSGIILLKTDTIYSS